MKRVVAFGILLLASCAVPQPEMERHGPPIELAGRSPGPPDRCVPTVQLNSLRRSENDPHTLIYGGGRTIWANNLGQCRFGADDILVTEPHGSTYCRGDLVRSIDRTSHLPGPACVLNDFIPFRT